MEFFHPLSPFVGVIAIHAYTRKKNWKSRYHCYIYAAAIIDIHVEKAFCRQRQIRMSFVNSKGVCAQDDIVAVAS